MSAAVEFSGRKVTVKTLTMADVREVLDEIQKSSKKQKSLLDTNLVDLLFDDDVPAIAVAKATGLSLDELVGNIPPDDVRKLIDKVRAANPFFVGMMERLVAIGSGGAQTQGPSSKRSAS